MVVAVSDERSRSGGQQYPTTEVPHHSEGSASARGGRGDAAL